jgi:hypothetical protein
MATGDEGGDQPPDLPDPLAQHHADPVAAQRLPLWSDRLVTWLTWLRTSLADSRKRSRAQADIYGGVVEKTDLTAITLDDLVPSPPP